MGALDHARKEFDEPLGMMENPPPSGSGTASEE